MSQRAGTLQHMNSSPSGTTEWRQAAERSRQGPVSKAFRAGTLVQRSDDFTDRVPVGPVHAVDPEGVTACDRTGLIIFDLPWGNITPDRCQECLRLIVDGDVKE